MVSMRSSPSWRSGIVVRTTPVTFSWTSPKAIQLAKPASNPTELTMATAMVKRGRKLIRIYSHPIPANLSVTIVTGEL